MNVDRLHEIIRTATVLLRQGEIVHGDLELVEQVLKGEQLTAAGVVNIDAMPHHSEAPPELEKVDMILVQVGVDKVKAAEIKAELAAMLEEWRPGLSQGPSFISWGQQVGDQGAAMQLMALGKVLGFWDVITPKTLGAEDDAEARYMASMGYLMTNGLNL